MSFLEERSDIALCNRALSRISQQALSGALDDPANANKHAARECKLHYKDCVRSALRAYHWGLVTKRAALAQAPVNDREGEWLFAYLAPTDMAFPVSMNPDTTGGGVAYYTGLGYILATLYGRPMFRYEQDKIYSQIDSATLDYVSYEITEQDFNSGLEEVIELTLASRLARSIAKDHKLADSFEAKAASLTNLEIARGINNNGPRYGQGPSDSERARAGFDLSTDLMSIR